jgi:hypothetical protein
MGPEFSGAVVWIGLASVIPDLGCEMLSPDKGAYIHLLTLANTELEYRTKVFGALSHYKLVLLQLENIRPLQEAESVSEEIAALAKELNKLQNPQHVRYGCFHTFPRLM